MNKHHENRIGLFFGSYNPIHIGHMAIANYVVEYTDLKEVWFVISPQSPFKKREHLLDNYERLEMVNRAINDDERFKASDIEFQLPVPSYTIDTLTYLSEKFPKRKFALIMGADNLFHFYKWKNFELVKNQFHIYVYPRPGIHRDECPKFDNLHWVEAPLMDISASFIRKAIREGKNVSQFLPSGVWKYIDEMFYYRR